MDWLSPLKSFFEFALPVLDKVPVIRAIIGFFLVFFVPGFAWTLILFKRLGYIERIALSIGLSVALITVSVIFTNVVLDIRITGLNSLLVIVVLTLIPLIVYIINKWLKKKREALQTDESDASE